MDDHSVHRFVIKQIGDYTYKLDDVLSNNTWEIEILKESHASFIKRIKELTPSLVNLNK